MVESFEIKLASSTGVFFPGQVVEGYVLCVTRERIKARAIVLYVIGRSKVQWIERAKNQPHHGHSATSYAGSRFYSNEVIYINSEITLWSPRQEDDHHLYAGSHKFQFNFILPENCAPSFEGELGYIRYWVRAKIDRPWSLDSAARAIFTVMPHFDLREIKFAANSVERKMSKVIRSGFCCAGSEGRVLVEATLTKCGVVPGETIMMLLKIQNGAPRTLNDKSFLKTLDPAVERTFWHMNPVSTNEHNERFWLPFQLLIFLGYLTYSLGGKVVRRDSDRSIQTFKDAFEVPSNKLGECEFFVHIPPLVPTFSSCPIIQVDYFFRVKIFFRGWFVPAILIEVPLIILTSPCHPRADFLIQLHQLREVFTQASSIRNILKKKVVILKAINEGGKAKRASHQPVKQKDLEAAVLQS